MQRRLRRAAIAAFGLISIALAITFAAGLASDLYGTMAAEHRGRGLFTLAGVSAARQAVVLQPWRAGYRADLGWMMGLRGEMLRMRGQYRRALRLAPASAYLWLEYSLALARSYQFDDDYTIALRQATVLAPSARPIRAAAARMGARHWNQGGEADRKLWAQDMSDVLATAPYDLLWTVLRDGREANFCGFVGSELGLSRWCFAVNAARSICDALPSDTKGPAVEQCERLGLLHLPAETDDDRAQQ
ncbi:MAG TPA: hypothetical protein VFB36_10430 [Nevskiaceae bacterium]|nr:hypothetical protein [Nevskiaceae bacterium]